MTVDRAGRISARALDAPNSPLGRCLAVELGSTSVPAPGQPTSFLHVFKLRATPDRG